MSRATAIDARALKVLNEGNYSELSKFLTDGVPYTNFIFTSRKPVGLLTEEGRMFQISAEKGQLSRLLNILNDDQKWPNIYKQEFGRAPQYKSQKMDLLSGMLSKNTDGKTALQTSIEAGDIIDVKEILAVFPHDKHEAIISATFKGTSTRAAKLATEQDTNIEKILASEDLSKPRAEISKIVETSYMEYLPESGAGIFHRLITFAVCHGNDFWGMSTDKLLESFGIKTFKVGRETIDARYLANALFKASSFANKELTLRGGKVTSLKKLEEEAESKLEEFKTKKYKDKSTGEEFSMTSLSVEEVRHVENVGEVTRDDLECQYDTLRRKLYSEDKHDILGADNLQSITVLKRDETDLKFKANGYFRDMMIDFMVRKILEKGQGNVDVSDLLPNVEDSSLAAKLSDFVLRGDFEEKEGGPSPTAAAVPKAQIAEKKEEAAAAAAPLSDRSDSTSQSSDKENHHASSGKPISAAKSQVVELKEFDPALMARELVKIAINDKKVIKSLGSKFGTKFIEKLRKEVNTKDGAEDIAAFITAVANTSSSYIEKNLPKAAGELKMQFEDFIPQYIATWEKSWLDKAFGQYECTLWDLISAKGKDQKYLEAVYKRYVEDNIFTSESANFVLKTPIDAGAINVLELVKSQGLFGAQFWQKVLFMTLGTPQILVAKLYVADSEAPIVDLITDRKKVMEEDVKYSFANHSISLICKILVKSCIEQNNLKKGAAEAKKAAGALKSLCQDLDYTVESLKLMFAHDKLYLPQYKAISKQNEGEGEMITLQAPAEIDIVIQQTLKLCKNLGDQLGTLESLKQIEGFSPAIKKVKSLINKFSEYYKYVPQDDRAFDANTIASRMTYLDHFNEKQEVKVTGKVGDEDAHDSYE